MYTYILCFRLSEHVDFSEDLGTNMRKPACSSTESLGVPALDLIDSVRDASSLNYEPETALEDKFRNIGPRAESIDAVATRIARTLEQVSFQMLYFKVTVEPLSNDHPHQRPSLLYDHISRDEQRKIILFI